MKLNTLLTTLAVTAIAVSSNLSAGEICMPKDVCTTSPSTTYAFAYGGYSFAHETESSINLGGLFGVNNVSIDNGVDGGFILGAGIGMRSCFLGGSRFEFEGLYSNSDMDDLTIGIPGVATVNLPVDGELKTKAFFANVLKEIPFDCFTAYAGAGLGVATTEWRISSNLGGLLPLPIGLEGEDTSLAYQIKIGADFPVAENLSIFGEYKMIGVTDTDYTAIILPVNTDHYLTHNIVFGARVGF